MAYVVPDNGGEGVTMGESARKARKAAHLTMTKLAKMAGVSLSTIYNLEKDRSSPNVLSVEALALALNISMEEYIGSEIDCVHVVRCKDCSVPHDEFVGCPKLLGLVTPPWFYCPYGERKT